MAAEWGASSRRRAAFFALCAAFTPASDARKFHDNTKRKHGHTYLAFCTNGDWVQSQACLEQVTAKWPQGAVLDDLYCVSPGAESGVEFTTIQSVTGSCAGSPNYGNVFVYRPITIPMGLTTLHKDYKRGADVDTLTSWDRVRCRDGELFATGWHAAYTPQECARLCSLIKNFKGKTCT